MEFKFDINIVLPLEITIINGDYRILNHGHAARILNSEKLTSIIDGIGEASYIAQGLPGPVTTSRKFRISDHRLYIVKNSTDNKNLGSIIGFLKVGAKHLYVYDSNGQVHERTPLCVLDFYVHESKQRSGYGKRLFDIMLEFEKCNAHELAIDRPSNKCLGFFQKHYHLSAPIRQVNNFVVYNAFFNRSPTSKSHIDRNFPVDNFRRQESTSRRIPSGKQHEQNHRPSTEEHDNYRNNRVRTVSDQNESFKSRRQASTIETSSTNDERKPFSAFPTSYGHHYNQTRELTNLNEINSSAPYIHRAYTGLFNENNPFPSLQRYNTNPVISTTKLNPPPTYTYKDYQSGSTNNLRRPIDNLTEPEPLTSIFAFPSLIKPNNNWRKPHQQQSTIDSSSSSAWRLFGVNRLLN